MDAVPNLLTFAEALRSIGTASDILAELTEEFKNTELTYAEKVLIYEGTKIGLANCYTPTKQSSYKWYKESRTPFIRAEILEWLFFPSRAEKIFKKGKIRIVGAYIDRYFELKSLVNFENFPILRKYEDSYSLNLAYTSIKIDIVFEGCTFYGGIGLSNSNTKDFILKACRIGYTVHKDYWGSEFRNSIKADNIITNGDLKITDYHDEQADNNISYSSFNSNYNGTKSVITHDIFLESAKVTELLSFSFLEIKGDLNLKEIETRQIYLNHCTINGWLNLNMATVKDVLWADGGKFLGGGNYDNKDTEQNYSISAVGAVIGWATFRSNAEIINGIDLSAIKTNLIIFRSSFVSKNIHTGIAINLSRSEIITDIYLSKGMLVSGRIDLYDSKIGRNLELSQSKFIGSIEPNLKSLNCDNINVGSKISFTKNKANLKTILDELEEAAGESIQTPNVDLFEKKKEYFIKQSLKIRKMYYEQFNLKNKKVENGEITIDDLRKWYTQACDFISKYEDNVYYKPLNDLRISYELLTDEIIKDGIAKDSEELKSTLIETSIVIGEASFSGIKLNGQFDCSNCAFIGMNSNLDIYRPKSSEINWQMRLFKSLGINIPRNSPDELNNFPNALTIKYAKIDGDLFLNEGPDESPIPFRAVGEVNLHSSKMGQFFVSPIRGEHEYTKWKLIGLKYDYIYSKNINSKSLKNKPIQECSWFYDYNEENNRQPYEQLATVYLKYGEDKIARDTLLSAYPKSIAEGLMLSVLHFFSKIGIPHYIALRNIAILFLLGWFIYYRASITNGIAPTSKIGCLNIANLEQNQVLFSPFFYSVQTTIPLMSSEQKNLFTPKFYSGNNFLFKNSILYIDSGKIATFWLSFSALLGIILISMFIISITKIIRKN